MGMCRICTLATEAHVRYIREYIELPAPCSCLPKQSICPVVAIAHTRQHYCIVHTHKSPTLFAMPGTDMPTSTPAKDRRLPPAADGLTAALQPACLLLALPVLGVHALLRRVLPGVQGKGTCGGEDKVGVDVQMWGKDSMFGCGTLGVEYTSLSLYSVSVSTSESDDTPNSPWFVTHKCSQPVAPTVDKLGLVNQHQYMHAC